jgi:hypothetical protein
LAFVFALLLGKIISINNIGNPTKTNLPKHKSTSVSGSTVVVTEGVSKEKLEAHTATRSPRIAVNCIFFYHSISKEILTPPPRV